VERKTIGNYWRCFMLRTTLAMALALATVPALAQTQAQAIFKCTDAAGKVEYRNSACPSGTEAAALDMQVAADNTLEIRRGSDQRREIGTTTVIERPAPPVRAAQPAAPVNALPPPPPEEARR
jgi:hypothetical protein